MALHHSTRFVIAATCGALALSACGGDDAETTSTVTAPADAETPSDDPTTTEADDTAVDPNGDGAVPPAVDLDRTFENVPDGVTLDVVATDLEAPWEVAFTSDGRAWVSERDTGVISVIETDGTRNDVGTLDVAPEGEGGLLGLAVDPETDELFAYLTGAADNRIVRVDPTDGSTEPVFTGIPKSFIHNGGRIAFGPDGMLYAGTGDAAEPELSQDPDSLAGKVLRIAPDGSIPDDNPIDGSAVYSIGHRNVQGLAWDNQDRLWITEFGPDVDDELNLIEPGANYGWPEVTGDSDGEFADPALVMEPAESSPSGLAFVGGDSSWGDSLVFGALRGQRLWQAAPAADGSLTDVRQVFEGTFGRVRSVVAAPDGTVWLLTNNTDGRGQPRNGDDLIVRLTFD